MEILYSIVPTSAWSAGLEAPDWLVTRSSLWSSRRGSYILAQSQNDTSTTTGYLL